MSYLNFRQLNINVCSWQEWMFKVISEFQVNAEEMLLVWTLQKKILKGRKTYLFWSLISFLYISMEQKQFPVKDLIHLNESRTR